MPTDAEAGGQEQEFLRRKVANLWGAHLVDVDPEIRARSTLYALDKKEPGSPEWAYQLLCMAVGEKGQGERIQQEVIGRVAKLIEARAYDSIPTAAPYGNAVTMVEVELALPRHIAEQVVLEAGGTISESRWQSAEALRAKVMALRDTGMTQQAIADELGITQPRVAQIINELLQSNNSFISNTAQQQAEAAGVNRTTLYRRRQKLNYLQQHAPDLCEEALKHPERLNDLYRRAQTANGDKLQADINAILKAILRLPEEGQEAALAKIFHVFGDGSDGEEDTGADLEPDIAPEPAAQPRTAPATGPRKRPRPRTSWASMDAKTRHDVLLERARPYSSRKAFAQGDSGAYNAARYHNLYDRIAAELGWVK
jgi:predicted transcriptional regulator